MAERYLTGFGNEHQSEAIAGTLPQGQFSPQKVARGLYAEQFSSTAFTAPRAVEPSHVVLSHSAVGDARRIQARSESGAAGAQRADNRGGDAAEPTALGSVVDADRAHRFHRGAW